MKKPVLHGMAARLYPDCGKRFFLEWMCWMRGSNATYFPTKEIIQTRNLSPYLGTRKMHGSSFLYSVAFPSVCSTYANEVCVLFMVKKASSEEILMQPGLCTLGSSWTSWTRNRTYLESSSTASVWFLFEVIGAKVGETPTEQNQQKMQGLQMRCVLGDFVGCRCRMM